VSAQATFFHQAGARVSVATADDAWLFVDGRLAVDLGGLGPKTGGVALDALSLVPGQQYKLALFTAHRCVSVSVCKASSLAGQPAMLVELVRCRVQMAEFYGLSVRAGLSRAFALQQPPQWRRSRPAF